MAAHTPKPGWVRYLVSWPILLLIPFISQADYWTWKLMEYAVIASNYGSQVYADGLMVVNAKQGLLSDGRTLSNSEQVVLNLGSWLLCVPLVIGVALGLSWINMRLHGKRRRDAVGGYKPAEPAAAPAT